MTPEAVIGAAAILVTLLLALFGSTWHISSLIARITESQKSLSEDVKEHMDKDDRRFEEVFRQQKELASQYFWLAANLMDVPNHSIRDPRSGPSSR